MQRELNPELFGNQTEGGVRHAAAPEANSSDLAWRKVFELQLSQIQAKLKENDLKLDSMVARVNEFMGATQTRIERTAKATQRLEELYQQSLEEAGKKMAQLNSRVSERKVSDLKIEEMMDRHNQVVKNFEVRLNQLQRLISEKEMLLMNAHAALEEARQEIARMKRL